VLIMYVYGYMCTCAKTEKNLNDSINILLSFFDVKIE